jgi:hypothetical protein
MRRQRKHKQPQDPLLRMAQEWLRLAHEYSGATWPFSRSSVGERAAMQQQQQVKPDEDKKE